MFKSLFVSASVLVIGLFATSSVMAQEQICTQVYGGGIICGAKHEAVPTGLGENLALIGALALGASATLLYFAKKNKSLALQN